MGFRGFKSCGLECIRGVEGLGFGCFRVQEFRVWDALTILNRKARWREQYSMAPLELALALAAQGSSWMFKVTPSKILWKEPGYFLHGFDENVSNMN